MFGFIFPNQVESNILDILRLFHSQLSFLSIHLIPLLPAILYLYKKYAHYFSIKKQCRSLHHHRMAVTIPRSVAASASGTIGTGLKTNNPAIKKMKLMAITDFFIAIILNLNSGKNPARQNP